MLLALEEEFGEQAIYVSCDAVESASTGFLEQLWDRAARIAAERGRAVVLLDEVHQLADWAMRLKVAWDRLRRQKLPAHVVATGSSALRLATGSQESLAGRFERLNIGHWNAQALVDGFDLSEREATDAIVRSGAYPGAFRFRRDPERWRSYVKSSILEPALGRDLLALVVIRKPALLRQVFAAAAAAPAQIVSLQKMHGQLHDAGALETIAHYLSLLEEAYLVVALQKYSAKSLRRRASPPKLVVLNNALLAATDPRGAPDPRADPARYGAWLENACIAHAWNSGQDVHYWREEPLEVDAILEGSWGQWAVEFKSGPASATDLRGLLEFHARYPKFRPLLVGVEAARPAAERSGITFLDWREYLLRGTASLGR